MEKISKKSVSSGYNTSGITNGDDRKIRSILAKLRRNGIVIYPENHQAVTSKLTDIALKNGLSVLAIDGRFILMDELNCKRFVYGK